MKKALSLDEIPVIQYEDQLRAEILEDCLQAGHIGATYINLGPNQNTLMCLTTKDKIYVINMMLIDDVEFLRQLLQLQDLRIYILGGQYVADRIYRKFHLKLNSLFDLNTFDTFLSLKKKQLQERTVVKLSLEIAKAFNIKFHDRVKLQRFWLKLDLPDRDQGRELEETEAIRSDMESVQAKNVIRYRAFATRALAMTMNDGFDALQHQDTDNLYKFAVIVGAEDYVTYSNHPDKFNYDIVMAFIKHDEQGSSDL